MTPKYECLRKIITLTVEYADFGGEENFITEENVLAETFSEAEKVLAVYLEGRQYHIISYCWKHSVISTPPNIACTGRRESRRKLVGCAFLVARSWLRVQSRRQ